jgi:hypothetical protein
MEDLATPFVLHVQARLRARFEARHPRRPDHTGSLLRGPVEQRVLKRCVPVGQTRAWDNVDGARVSTIEIDVHLPQRERADRFEYRHQAKPFDFRTPPGPGELSPNSVPKRPLALDDHDVQSTARQHTGQGRASEPAAGNGNIEDAAAHRLSTVHTPPTMVA